jgi:hypothetical protein
LLGYELTPFVSGPEVGTEQANGSPDLGPLLYLISGKILARWNGQEANKGQCDSGVRSSWVKRGPLLQSASGRIFTTSALRLQEHRRATTVLEIQDTLSPSCAGGWKASTTKELVDVAVSGVRGCHLRDLPKLNSLRLLAEKKFPMTALRTMLCLNSFTSPDSTQMNALLNLQMPLPLGVPPLSWTVVLLDLPGP